MGVFFVLLAGLPELAASQSPAPSSPTGNDSQQPFSIRVPGATKVTNDDPTDRPRATLHVYTNLMQVPVLVLT